MLLRFFPLWTELKLFGFKDLPARYFLQTRHFVHRPHTALDIDTAELIL